MPILFLMFATCGHCAVGRQRGTRRSRRGRSGFAEVIELEDLKTPRLEEVLKNFGDKAADAD
jgi:hypothetical protein